MSNDGIKPGEDELEFEAIEVEAEDGSMATFAILDEFQIEGKTFIVITPIEAVNDILEGDGDEEITVLYDVLQEVVITPIEAVNDILEGDGDEEITVLYDVLQEGEDGETYMPPEERYHLLAMKMAEERMESGK